MQLDTKDLRLIQTIAEAGTLTRAAQALHLTQSALSYQLRELEARLDASLFERFPRKMRPTAAGEYLLSRSKEVLTRIQEIESELHAFSNNKRGYLRFTTGCYTCYNWLPTVLKRFSSKYPDVEIRIELQATRRPVEALLEGEIDLAILNHCVADPRLSAEQLFEDELMAVVPKTHPLARKKFVELRDFASENLLLHTSPTESSFCSLLAEKGIEPRTSNVHLTEAILEMVHAGLGVSVLANWMVRQYAGRRDVVTLRIGKAGTKRMWHVAMRRAAPQLPFVGDFIQAIRTEVQAT